MAKRITKTAALENQGKALEHAQSAYLNAARERDDARAEATLLRAQLDAISGDCEDGKVCARLAVVLCPDDDPKQIGPRDLEIACKRIAEKQARIAKLLKDAADRLDDNIDTTMEAEELAEAVFDATKNAEKDKTLLAELAGAFPTENPYSVTNKEQKAALKALCAWFHASDRTTNEWDRLEEIVELLGLSGTTLKFVLAASDMAQALRAIH
jgi:hypothetical protein